MKFNVDSEVCAKALSNVIRLCTSKGFPSLSYIHIEAKGDKITLISTDLARNIRVTVPAIVDKPGEVLVSGKSFHNLMGMVDGRVHCSLDDTKLNVDFGTDSHYSLTIGDPDDYPVVYPVANGEKYYVKFSASRIVKVVLGMVSKDEMRPIINSVLLCNAPEGGPRFVAVDGHRLVTIDGFWYSEDESVWKKDPFQYNIPSDLLRLLSPHDLNHDIEILIDDPGISIRTKYAIYTAKLVEGNYPQYKAVIPVWDTVSHTFIVDVDAWVDRLKRLSTIIVSDLGERNILMEVHQDYVLMKDDGAVEGVKGQERVPITDLTEVPAFEAYFDMTKMLSIVKHCEGQLVKVGLIDQTAPIKLKPVESGSLSLVEYSGVCLDFLCMPIIKERR